MFNKKRDTGKFRFFAMRIFQRRRGSFGRWNSKINMLNASAIILAGGKSSRMKVNKAFVTINQQKMIALVVEKLRLLFNEVIVVTNKPEDYSGLGVKTATDLVPGQGPLGGIQAGLIAASNQHSFVMACDMPFVEPALISYLVGESHDNDVVVPKIGDYIEPLHAVYSKDCLEKISECLDGGKHKVYSFYDQVKVKYVDLETLKILTNPEKAFFNVNTPEDLARAKVWAGDKD